MFSGVVLGPESRGELGKKLVILNLNLGLSAYSKDPRSKWWDGYRSQSNIVIDEFRGTIDVSHILRWLDRYPISVEVKGGTRPLAATKVWITSNLDPRMWYPDLDQESKDALLRRFTNITHFI